MPSVAVGFIGILGTSIGVDVEPVVKVILPKSDIAPRLTLKIVK